MWVTLLIGLVALIAGYFFVKKFSTIECYIFGNGDKDEYGAESGEIFLIISIAFAALASAWLLLVNVFNLDFSKEMIVYAGVGLVAVDIFAAMAHAMFNSTSIGRMLGKMLFMAVSCVIGALMGVAGSVIVFAILALMFALFVLKAMLSGGLNTSSSSSNSNSPANDDVEISVEGELGVRRAKDLGGGTYRDNCGDTWTRKFDGTLVKDD